VIVLHGSGRFGHLHRLAESGEDSVVEQYRLSRFSYRHPSEQRLGLFRTLKGYGAELYAVHRDGRHHPSACARNIRPRGAVPARGFKDWDKLVVELNTQAVFAAKLLAGEMPQDIETAFAKAELSLFPKSHREIKTSCSCPDSSNPCKHIAAVYYIIGEEFDRDPFLLFRLRGTEREMICGRLSAAPAGPDVKPQAAEPAEHLPPESLPVDAAFWASGPLPADLCGDVRMPPVNAAVPKRLGGFPFWRDTDRFLDAIVSTYSAAARRGLAVFEAENTVPAGCSTSRE